MNAKYGLAALLFIAAVILTAGCTGSPEQTAQQIPEQTLSVSVSESGGNTGFYTVYCAVDGASVTVDGKGAGTISGGELAIPWTVGSTPYNTMVVRKEGYKTATVSMPKPPAAGKTSYLNVVLEPETVADDSVLVINCTPKSANIYINGELRGVAPMKLRLDPGTYSVIVIKIGYDSVTDTVTLEKGKTVARTYSLSKTNYKDGNNYVNYGMAVITSVPQGAQVYLDNGYQGATPLVLPKLKTGKYSLSITMGGYATYTQDLIISANSNTEIAAHLEDAESPGKILLSVTPAPAEIFVDGVPYGTIQNAGVPVEAAVYAGKHTITAKKDGYFDASREVTVGEDETAEVSIELGKIGTAYETGSGAVYAASNPPGASVYIDDKFEGTTPLMVQTLSSGEHAMRFELDGYKTSEGIIQIENGKRQQISVTLEAE